MSSEKNNVKKGWLLTIGESKAHYYFDNLIAVCSRHMIFSLNALEDCYHESPENCRSCYKKAVISGYIQESQGAKLKREFKEAVVKDRKVITTVLKKEGLDRVFITEEGILELKELVAKHNKKLSTRLVDDFDLDNILEGARSFIYRPETELSGKTLPPRYLLKKA